MMSEAKDPWWRTLNGMILWRKLPVHVTFIATFLLRISSSTVLVKSMNF